MIKISNVYSSDEYPLETKGYRLEEYFENKQDAVKLGRKFDAMRKEVILLRNPKTGTWGVYVKY